jgi:hypothetical protein
MLRSVFSAVALAGFLATVSPAFADPVAATAFDHAQAATSVTQQAVPPAPAQSSSPEATPVSAERGKDVPVGFGWG